MTIVPADMWDDTDYYFTCKDRTLHLFKKHEEEDVTLGTYPRDVVIEQDKVYNSDFMQCLATQTIKGTKRHILYPMPDSFFLWNDDVTSVKGVTRVSTVSTSVDVMMPTPVEGLLPAVPVDVALLPHAEVPVDVASLPHAEVSQDEHEALVDGVSPSLSRDHQECLEGLAERKNDQAYDAIQDFLPTLDVRLSHDEERAVAAGKAQTLDDKLHHVLVRAHCVSN